jgi:1,2-phenylacetyl-CoA epoxidase catalytic subunit
MTYSRHYPFLESVFDAFERDLARTVAFFKLVDRIKPARAAVMKQHGIATEDSAEFLRAYEAAVVETIKKTLAELPPTPSF